MTASRVDWEKYSVIWIVNEMKMIVMSIISYMSFQELAARAPVKSGLTANYTAFIVFVLRKVITFCYEEHIWNHAMNVKSEEGGIDWGFNIDCCILSKDDDDITYYYMVVLDFKIWCNFSIYAWVGSKNRLTDFLKVSVWYSAGNYNVSLLMLMKLALHSANRH